MFLEQYMIYWRKHEVDNVNRQRSGFWIRTQRLRFCNVYCKNLSEEFQLVQDSEELDVADATGIRNGRLKL